MHKVVGWIREHPVIVVLGVFVFVCVCAHYFLNWRAERRWQTYAAEARSRGVKLALTDFERPEIPDAENFAALPMMRAIFASGAKSPMELPGGRRPGSADPAKGERFPWEKWQQYFKDAGFIAETTDSPPADVLRALEHYASQFEEWSQWKTRPRCRFALDLKAGAAMPLPHLSLFQHAAVLFSLRMRAHLALGDSTAAYEDFREGFQAYRALVNEPTLINGLVRISALSIMSNGVRDGLNDHTWGEPELRKIDADFATVRVWEDYRQSFSSERGFGNWFCETLKAAAPSKRGTMLVGLTSGPSSPDALLALIPARFIRDNQLRYNQYFDEMLARVNSNGTDFDADGSIPSNPKDLHGFDQYYYFLFHLSAGVYSDVEQRYLLLQTRVDQTRLSIAIERFRVAHRAVPEALAEIVPNFITQLPRDIFTREPMIYRRNDDGGFLLYSVGPNRRDDGGAVKPRLSEQNQLDWMWIGTGIGPSEAKP